MKPLGGETIAQETVVTGERRNYWIQSERGWFVIMGLIGVYLVETGGHVYGYEPVVINERLIPNSMVTRRSQSITLPECGHVILAGFGVMVIRVGVRSARARNRDTHISLPRVGARNLINLFLRCYFAKDGYYLVQVESGLL